MGCKVGGGDGGLGLGGSEGGEEMFRIGRGGEDYLVFVSVICNTWVGRGGGFRWAVGERGGGGRR